MAVGMVMVQEFPCAGRHVGISHHVTFGAGPVRTLTDELVVRPRPWRAAVVMQPVMIDLEESQVLSSCLRTVTSTPRQVVKHWAMMRIWPCIPLECDLRARRHRDRSPSWGRQLVTGDVCASEGIWRDEPAVLVVCVPACGHLDLVCGLVVPVLEKSASTNRRYARDI